MSAFRDTGGWPFVTALEAAFPAIIAELRGLRPEDFPVSPDSLAAVADGYDETGWRYYALSDEARDLAAHRERCPATAHACDAVPGLVNAGFSLFRPGTHLYPHHGERSGVLRCHLALQVPPGDVGIRSGAEIQQWHAGRCLVFDDTFEHEAWNHGASDRVLLLVTFRPDVASDR
ncbi:MAG: aspartyl/asparaginyl beta-hydroxylase domain-containing protein [Planctomycetota bacterium]